MVSLFVSVWLFSNQVFYVGVVPQAYPQVGDIAPFVGFLLAGIIYAALFKLERLNKEEVLVVK